MAESLEADVDVLAPALDQPVGVDHQDVAHLEPPGRLLVGGGGIEAERGVAGVVEPLGTPRSAHERIRMAGACVGEAVVERIDDDAHRGGVRRTLDRTRDPAEPVEGLGRSAPLEQQGSGGGPQLGHGRGGFQAVADAVPDHQCPAAALELDDVVPVAADGEHAAGREVAGCDGGVVAHRPQHRLLERVADAPVLVELDRPPVGLVERGPHHPGEELDERGVGLVEGPAGVEREGEHAHGAVGVATHGDRHRVERAAADRGRLEHRADRAAVGDRRVDLQVGTTPVRGHEHDLAVDPQVEIGRRDRRRPVRQRGDRPSAHVGHVLGGDQRGGQLGHTPQAVVG